MKILILTSGGDAPGMNATIHFLTKRLMCAKHKVFASKYGFQGLLDNNVIQLNVKLTKKHKNLAGSFIKASRCLEFKQEKGQKRAFETLEKNQIDFVIIIGGDGSLKGAKVLVEKGYKVLFIPATIDKDLPYKTYSLGFFTAAYACCKYIEDVKLTMQAFDRICIYQIMGRNNPSLTNLVAQQCGADLAITAENKNAINFDKLLKQYEKNPSLTVLLQENLLPITYIENLLEEKTGGGVRSCVIGYVQRGTNPIASEKKLAKKFAFYAVKLIKEKKFNLALAIDEQNVKSVCVILKNR